MGQQENKRRERDGTIGIGHLSSFDGDAVNQNIIEETNQNLAEIRSSSLSQIHHSSPFSSYYILPSSAFYSVFLLSEVFSRKRERKGETRRRKKGRT
jgi:hypothetical protein